MRARHVLLAAICLVLSFDSGTAFARKQYMDAFKAKYPAVAARQKITCYLCHGKSKKVRNDFGALLADKVGKKNQKDKGAIDAALSALESAKSVIPGKNYGELFSAGVAPDGFVAIFDGKTLDGWDGDPKLWSVQDGAITGITTDDKPIQANTFIIWKGGKVANFEIEFEYKIINGNSGMQYRSFMLENAGKWAVGGYQADFEAKKTYSGILYGEKFRGILANRGDETEVIRDGNKVVKKKVGTVGKSEEIQAKIKPEDWNKYSVSANGFRFVHKINGVLTCVCTDKDEKMRRKDGILAFQLHRGPAMKIQIRNVRLKVLPDTKPPKADK